MNPNHLAAVNRYLRLNGLRGSPSASAQQKVKNEIALVLKTVEDASTVFEVLAGLRR